MANRSKAESAPESFADPRLYRIRIRRGEVELDLSSPDPAWVDVKLEALEALFSGGATEASTAAEPGLSTPFTGPKPVSLAEHVRAVDPSGGLEHVLAVGYYLERYSGLKGGFRRRDLAEAFSALRYHHSNPGVPIAAARRRGLLMDGEEHEKLQLTETAERWVKERLNPER